MGEAARLYDRITRLDAADPLTFHFSPGAQELFIEFLTELERKIRNNELHPALESHLAKFRSLMPSLALLFELADQGVQTVSLGHARQAAAFCDYLESHARRVYSMIVSAERQGAAELGRRLAEGWKGNEGVFTVRDVYQNDWRGLETPNKVRLVLPILEDANWIRSVPQEATGLGGRPSERYAINPKVGRTK
jgi:putative DNA primase/helicase